jgi:hypothetical protein
MGSLFLSDSLTEPAGRMVLRLPLRCVGHGRVSGAHARVHDLRGRRIQTSSSGEAREIESWGRETLGSIIQADPNLARRMVLNGKELGTAYEQSSVLAKWYPVNGMPFDDELFDDAVGFGRHLKLIYDAEVLGLAPTGSAPEVLEVESVASGHTARRNGAQGFGLSYAERQVVEIHAMRLARQHLKKVGWRVRDVSATRSYDFECRRDGEKLIVEVKGTTSTGDQIVITRNEVATHRVHHPNNALVVVHSINLTRAPSGPRAEGGQLLVRSPWDIEEDRLRPLAFQYIVRSYEPAK